MFAAADIVPALTFKAGNYLTVIIFKFRHQPSIMRKYMRKILRSKNVHTINAQKRSFVRVGRAQPSHQPRAGSARPRHSSAPLVQAAYFTAETCIFSSIPLNPLPLAPHRGWRDREFSTTNTKTCRGTRQREGSWNEVPRLRRGTIFSAWTAQDDFREASQQIFEVDDLTAYLTCLLAESMSQRRLEADLVARGAAGPNAQIGAGLPPLHVRRGSAGDCFRRRGGGAAAHACAGSAGSRRLDSLSR